MEVNTNLSTIGVNGPTAAKGSAATPGQTRSNRTDTATLTTLDEAMQNLPGTRSDAVERARGLVSDPQYPSAEVVNRVSNLLAGKLNNQE
jgi:hypothetical protein